MFQLLVGTDFPFMKYRRIAYVVSGALILATAIWLIVNRGPRLGVDFTGGTLVQIRTGSGLPADRVRAALEAAGLRGFELQQLTSEHRDEFFVRFATIGTADPYPLLERAIKARFPQETVELRRTETVGPKVGSELGRKAVWAVFGSLGGILVYVGIRYEFKFAFGALIALFHDVFVTVGVLCFANREISLTVLAALMTIAGFSINDTIVIFDRIRERAKALRNERRSRVMDIAVNETLARTVITSLTVLFSALAMLLFGGEALHDFAFAMVVGLVLGTYSSVYVASGLALDTWIWLDRRKGVRSE